MGFKQIFAKPYRKIRNALFGQKAFNHIMSMIKERPLDINLELVSACPVKCCFCCNRKIKRDFTVMEMELFKKICIDYVNIGGGTLCLSSMHSDVFVDPLLLERLKFLKTLKNDLYIYTTNPLVSISKYDEEELSCILATFDFIHVSVIGTNKEDYLKMSGIDAFDLFYKNLYRVKNLIEKNKFKTKIVLLFRTYDISKLKNEAVFERLVKDFTCGGIYDTYFSWSGSISKEDVPEGARVIYKNNTEEKDNCTACNSTLAVNCQGKVVGCGCIDWESKNIVGDCNVSDLKTIWQSMACTGFRNAFENGNIPPICIECAYYSSVKDSFSSKKLAQYSVKDGLYYTI